MIVCAARYATGSTGPVRDVVVRATLVDHGQDLHWYHCAVYIIVPSLFKRLQFYCPCDGMTGELTSIG